MSKIKWYKRDPNSALTGMMCLSLEERGAYNTLLDLIYCHGGKIIDDDRFLSGWMRCDIRVWKRIKNTLIELGKIQLVDGHLTNFRATSEIDEALHRVASARQAGLTSGRNRRGDSINNSDLTRTPVATPVERYARATTTTTTREVSKKESVVGTRFALEDPPAEWIQFCQTQRPELNAGVVFDSFRDYWISKPGKAGVKLDWAATWRNWVRNQKSPTGGNYANQPTKQDRLKAAAQRAAQNLGLTTD